VKKWLIRILAGLSGLIVLVFLGGFYLLGTESGLNFLVSQAEKQLDGALQIGMTRGKILDRLELTDIIFKSPAAGIVKLDRLVLDWKSSDLFRLHLHILELSADTLSYTVSSQDLEPETSANEPLSLPDLNLPITFTVENFELHNFSFLSAPDVEPLSVNSANLALTWNNNGILLQKLHVTMEEGSLTGKGTINPIGNYPLQLTTTLTTENPDLPSLTFLGEYTGDLDKLVIKEQISGDLSAEINISVQDVLHELSWQGHLNIEELRLAAFNPDVSGIVKGTIKTNGNLQQAAATVTLSIRDEDHVELNWDTDLDVHANLEDMFITVNQLILKHTETPALIEVTGTADDAQNMDLTLQWHELQWPLTGSAQYRSARGKLDLTGTVDDYHLTVKNADMAGSILPQATLHLTADGNTESAENLHLKAELLEGEITVQGNIQWTPAVQWQLETAAKAINPGLQYPDWPGKLEWLIRTNGSIDDSGVAADILIHRLEGSLRKLPLAGTGKIAVQADDIIIDGLLFSSGSAVFSANGNLGNHSGLQWNMDLDNFSDLIPLATGQLHAKGTLQGEMNSPQIELQVSGSSIAIQDLNLEKLQADAALDLSWQKPFSLDISGSNLKSGDHLTEHVAIQGSGTREQHTLHFLANHDLADISLDLNGGYLEERWQGTVDQFNISATDLGSWKLQKPTPISASATGADIDKMCLSREESALCLNGSWDTENNDTTGNMEISKFPLAWLSPWFPDNLECLTGLFSAKASATMKERLQADITAAITPGTISYLTDRNEGRLSHEGMKADLHVIEDSLDAGLSLSIDSNTISATLNSPNLLNSEERGNAKLNGNIIIDAKKFDLVEALVPDVQNLNAAIDINLKIEGTLDQPDINGKGTINIPSIFIPIAGLELKDTTFAILAENKELRLNGKFNSPGGFMELDGNAIIDSSQNWPLRLTLKGDNFRLLNLPEIQIFLSSDLLLEKQDDILSLTGEASIPKAEVLLRELPQGSQTASPDVVIIQERKEEEEEEEATSPLRMKLKITLGDDVHFAGLGVNAFIDGQLTILSEPEEQMLGSGAFHIKQGSFRAYGQDLEIETGVISFPGGPLKQPGINLRATRSVGVIVAGIYAIGPLRKPRLTTFSNPPMSESQVISYLLTGSAPGDIGKGAKLSIGRQINNKLSVSIGTDVKTGDSEFIARYRLSRSIHVQTTTAANGNGVDIFYSVELGGEESKETTEKEFNPKQE
jgi:translocation and assembly module TamB